MTIGEKIKNERKKKGLTQNRLADGRITRNMLSAIESGKAMPSFDTLKSIARVLEMPIEYFVSEEDTPQPFIKIQAMPLIREHLKNKDYKSAVSIAENINADDEIWYIKALCYFELGLDAFKNGSLQSTIAYFNDSIKYCDMTVYDTERFRCSIPMYLAVAQNASSPLLEFDEESFVPLLYRSVDFEFYKYLIQDFDFEFIHPPYKLHIEAKKLMRERKYADALSFLSQIEQSRRLYGRNAFLIFCVYSDMENCYKQLFDFENAYKYASKRISLMEGFQS